jgi:hypothetical protein
LDFKNNAPLDKSILQTKSFYQAEQLAQLQLARLMGAQPHQLQF